MLSPLQSRVLLVVAAMAVWLTPAGAKAQSPKARAAQLVAKMTAAEKLELVTSGASGVPRLEVPPIIFRDGPAGVGEGEPGVTAFPAPVTLGSTWDPRLGRRLGVALADELRARGATELLAPTIEPLRNPLWGRAPETYGEDPHLNGRLAAQEVRGIQSKEVIAQIKHFAVNTQEFGRFGLPLTSPGTDSQVSERVLQEIYFPPFKAAIQDGNAASVMCSYNRINGTPSCQNPATLAILKGWGLQGFVGPDAIFAVRNAKAAADAGVDNFQLGAFPPGAEKTALPTVAQTRIDDAARRVVEAMAQTGLLDAGVSAKRRASTSAHRGLATEIAAKGSVLLKNRHEKRNQARVLPLRASDRKVAVIGYDAGKSTQDQEGGSPAVNGGRTIAPIAAIRNLAPSGTKVTYTKGTRGIVSLPVLPAGVLKPSSGSGQGLSAQFFAGQSPTFSGTPTATRVDPTIDFDTSTDSNTTQPLESIPDAGGAGSGRWTGTLTPPRSGQYRFSLTFAGNAKLFIGGKRIIGGDTEFVQGASAGFPGAPDITYQGLVKLKANKAVPIRVEYATNDSIGGAVLQLGWRPPEPTLRRAAVRAARKADTAVVFVNDVVAEGMDRTSLALPGDQDGLIRAVAKANPNTVVVLHTGSAVLMPWRKRVAGIVEAWYPGQQSGKAIARVLFGRTAPEGRLPVTFPAGASQNPTVKPPADTTGPDNVRKFTEGLEVGYRYYDAAGKEPLFPFGYGLTYTTFKESNLKVSRKGSGARVRVRVKNTGRRTGSEVVQVYLGFPKGSGEPPKQLKAFRKVAVKPGRTRTVTLRLDADSFEVFSEAKRKWVTPEGRFRVFAGSSSRDLPLHTSIRVGG